MRCRLGSSRWTLCGTSTLLVTSSSFRCRPFTRNVFLKQTRITSRRSLTTTTTTTSLQSDNDNSSSSSSSSNNNNNNNNSDNDDASMMIPMVQQNLDLQWNDRIGLQARYSLPEKGWQVPVDWRATPYGAGCFYVGSKDHDSSESGLLKAGTVLRRGRLGVNLIPFASVPDIDAFCLGNTDHQPTNNSNNANVPSSKEQQDNDYLARRDYVKDYLWGFYLNADEQGYPFESDDDRFFGMWVPGNGLNHNEEPNMVYRPVYGRNDGNNDNDDVDQGPKLIGIDLVALRDISPNEELLDDYRRHGKAPTWLKEFAVQHNVSLVFADCNDFVAE